MSVAAPNRSAGVFWGLLGMLGFSGTLVATRVAVADFTPLDITCARIVMAGGLGALFLFFTDQCTLPRRRMLLPIMVTGLGLAVAYPFFLALALETVPAVHGAVVTGLAPAATAAVALLRAGERPRPAFWIACLAGSSAVLYFAYDAGGGHLSLADGWLFLGVLSLGVAYAEGGRVSRELSGSVTLSWAMLFLTPFAIIVLVTGFDGPDPGAIPVMSWLSLIYLGMISMFLASVFWYRGLALGGIARIGQINLLLPLTALGWSALFLGEEITVTAIVCAVIVFTAMIVCLKSRN